jgi:3-oxoacyl-[acyl-carrier protein] reductase
MTSRVLFVTGATGGLGESVVRRLTSDGFRCLVAYRQRTKYEDLASGIDARDLVRGVPADLTDAESVENAAAVMSDHGIPWGLVHLAGGFVAASATETALETWDGMIELNLRGAFVALRAVARQLRNENGGRLVFVGASSALDLPPGMAAYAVSKVAVAGLVQVAAKELSGSGITVNAIMPDALDTRAMREAGLGIPLLSLDQVAATIGYLVSDEAASVTGSLVPLRAS